MNQKLLFSLCLVLLFFSCRKTQNNTDQHEFNSVYNGEYLNRVAFPIGGIGAGMFCLEGTGAISHVSVRNHPDVRNEPFIMAAL